MTELVQFNEIQNTHLSIFERQMLLLSLNTVLVGNGEVTVGVEYPKQTDTRRRIADRDYVAVPGVSNLTQLGQIISVHRQVDNAKNRRDGVVGRVYFKLDSFTRGDGASPSKPTNIRPSGLRRFRITGFVPTTNPQRQEAKA